jgi:hypothetical protein
VSCNGANRHAGRIDAAMLEQIAVGDCKIKASICRSVPATASSLRPGVVETQVLVTIKIFICVYLRYLRLKPIGVIGG